jgi:hypothetical protein
MLILDIGHWTFYWKLGLGNWEFITLGFDQVN